MEALKSNDYAKLQAAKKSEIEAFESKVPTTKGKDELEALNAKIDKAKTELAKIQSQGADPMKAIVAKQGEIDEYNKQLGIKEKAAKEEEKRTRTMIENSKEYLAIQQQIIDKVKELDAANASKNTTEGIRITKEISVLEKQLKTLADGGTAIKPISATIKTATGAKEQLKPMKQLTEEERKQLEIKGKKASADALALDGAKDEARIREEIVGYALQLVDALTKGLDLTEGQAEALNGAMNVMSQLGRGDYIGAAISGITTAVGAIMDTSGIEERLSKPWEEFENWISRSNDALERYIKLRDNAIGDERYSTSDVAIREAEAIKADAESKLNNMKLSWTFKDEGWFNAPYNNIDRAIDDLQKKLGGGLKMEGDEKEWGIGGAWKSIKQVVSYDLSQMTKDTAGNFSLDKLRELIKNGTVADEAVIKAVADYDANMDKLITLQKEKQELLTATMASSIADSIVQGFRDGYDSAADFADNFEALMTDAILNSVKINALEEPLKKWYDQFAKDMESPMSNGMAGLDETEKNALKEWWDRIVAGGIAASDAALDAAGVKLNSSSTRTGSSKGIAQASQDSIDEMNGRFTAIQGHTFSMNQGVGILVSNSNLILKSVQGIEKNTMSLSRLEAIENNIASVKQGIDTINLKGITLKP